MAKPNYQFEKRQKEIAKKKKKDEKLQRKQEEKNAGLTPDDAERDESAPAQGE